MGWQCSRTRWHASFTGQTACCCKKRKQEQESSDSHSQAERKVVPRRIGIDSGEGASVIAGRAGIGVKILTEAMRTRIVEVGNCRTRWVPIAVCDRLSLIVFPRTVKVDHGGQGRKEQ